MKKTSKPRKPVSAESSGKPAERGEDYFQYRKNAEVESNEGSKELSATAPARLASDSDLGAQR